MAPYRLFLLGRPELRIDSGPVAIPFGKPLALLAYLSLTEGPVSREQLANLLWPMNSRAKQRQSLRQGLVHVRHAVGDHALRSGDRVELRRSHVWCDVDRFRELLARGDVAGASVLWRGHFVERLDITSAPAWTRWKEDYRSRLEVQFGRALERKGTSLHHRGDAASAVRWYRRATSVQPYSPMYHRKLLEVLLELGRLDEFQRAWAEASGALSAVQALGDLADLPGKALALESDLTTGPRAVRGPRLPFTGRTTELSRLLSWWGDAQDSASSPIVVRGESGVGKTRLVEELAARVSPHARTVQVTCGESEDTPLAPLRRLIRGIRSLPGAMGTSPDTDAILDDITGGGVRDASTVSRALHDLVASVAYEAPLLLIVEPKLSDS